MEACSTSTSLLSSLPADVLDQVLKHCASMGDFSAAIRTSKRIYRVYKDHPTSIIRSVACNHMAMTEDIFPYAFGLVLHHERARMSDPPVKDWLGEHELSASHLDFSRFRQMVSNHEVVAQLEKEFSRKYKDSRFGYSVLSNTEAHRFQSSAYIFWQFQALFGIDTRAKVLPWEYDKRLRDNRLLTRRSFLKHIPTMSLLHLSAFKDWLIGWAECKYQDLDDDGYIQEYFSSLTKEQICHLLLSSGLDYVTNRTDPCDILGTFDDLSQKYARLQVWFANDLDIVITSGAISDQSKNSNEAKLITRQGPIFTSCRRCSLSTEPLYNNTNYRHIIISGFIIYLPEYLSSNQVETERIRAHLSVDDRKIYIPADLVCKLLWPSHVPHPSLADTTSDECDAKEIVSLLRVPLPVRFPGYTYDPRHMLCVTCFRGILRSKFWSWWEVHRKLPPVNAPDQPDCSYGLDCKRQRNAYHATLYNHWCPDTQSTQSVRPSAPATITSSVNFSAP